MYINKDLYFYIDGFGQVICIVFISNQNLSDLKDVKDHSITWITGKSETSYQKSLKYITCYIECLSSIIRNNS